MSEQTPEYQTDNHVYSYCVRQIEGLRAERDALKLALDAKAVQVDGLIQERDALRNKLRALLNERTG